MNSYVYLSLCMTCKSSTICLLLAGMKVKWVVLYLSTYNSSKKYTFTVTSCVQTIQHNLLDTFLRNVLIDPPPQTFSLSFLFMVQPEKPLPAKKGRYVNYAYTVQKF
jgi:hypothetical protein